MSKETLCYSFDFYMPIDIKNTEGQHLESCLEPAEPEGVFGLDVDFASSRASEPVGCKIYFLQVINFHRACYLQIRPFSILPA